MAAKCVDCSGPGNNFTAMPHAAWNRILLTGPDRNPLPIDDQGIAAPHNQHVFVISVDMLRRSRSLAAGPKRHLAPACAAEDITLNAGSRLTGPGDPVCRLLHKIREIVHREILPDFTGARQDRSVLGIGIVRRLN
jgi:hypothetical protein